MTRRNTGRFHSPRLSLADLCGRDYTESVLKARAQLVGQPAEGLRVWADQEIDFYPISYQERIDRLVDSVGKIVCPATSSSSEGAGNRAFRESAVLQRAPLCAMGPYRVGEDGRVYLAAKSEHYHASVGHDFPGYRLVENAARLGISRMTHNNSRGPITRRLEQCLVAAANGIAPGDAVRLRVLIGSEEPGVLNRVLNLQTGSLAAEAALKIVLARFYDQEADSGAVSRPGAGPLYAGRLPVILVLGDEGGGLQANYHGTAMVTQLLRGMWPELRSALEKQGGLRIRPVRVNDIAGFERAVHEHDRGRQKVAAFFHELVLMNYGVIRLEQAYVRKTYAICKQRDIPVVADEIQTGIWSPELFMFREYGVMPDVVSIGKGFSGGQSPASRVLMTPAMDNLSQFGALITNGQDELASLAYLITIEWVRANAAAIRAVGEHYQAQLGGLANRHAGLIERVEGRRHLGSIFFRAFDKAREFAAGLNAAGIDISVQTYKADCPPAAITKLPITVSHTVVDFLIRKMDNVLADL